MTTQSLKPVYDHLSSRASPAVRQGHAASRVVVTGVGISSPHFANAAAFWQAIDNDAQGGGDARAARTVLPATRFSDQKFTKFQDDTAKWALAATDEAITSAGLRVEAEGPEIGFALGTCFGPLRWGLHHVYRSAVIDPVNPRVSCFSSVIGYYGSAIGNVTIPMGFHGPSILFSNLDSSGADAIAYAFKTVESGRCAVMVCGGADAPVPQMWRHNEDTTQTGDGCRGEGAGILVLETMEHAQRRGATVLAELCGCSTGRKGGELSAAESLVSSKGLQFGQVEAVVAACDDATEWKNNAGDSTEAACRYMTDIAEKFGDGSAAMGAAAAVAAVKIAERTAVTERFFADRLHVSGDLNRSGSGYVMQCNTGGTGRTSALLFRGAPALLN